MIETGDRVRHLNNNVYPVWFVDDIETLYHWDSEQSVTRKYFIINSEGNRWDWVAENEIEKIDD